MSDTKVIARRRSPGPLLAALAALAVLSPGLQSCVTVDQRLLIDESARAPAARQEDGALPVSASPYVVLVGEETARGPEGLRLVGGLDRSLRLRAPLSERSLDPGLRALVGEEARRLGAAAAVNLSVELESFRVPLAAPIVVLRSSGAALAAAGTAMLVSGWLDPESYGSGGRSGGLSLLAPGLAGLGASWGLQALARTEWRIRVRADLVRPR